MLRKLGQQKKKVQETQTKQQGHSPSSSTTHRISNLLICILIPLIIFLLLAIYISNQSMFNNENTSHHTQQSSNTGDVINDQHQQSFDLKSLLFNDDVNQDIIQILKSQSNVKRKNRRIYKDINLPNISKYSQPSSVYDVIKKQFENAEWKPR